MGIYSQSTVTELNAMRGRLLASLQDRLTSPTAAGGNGRSVQFQQDTDKIKAEISAIDAEIQTRSGCGAVRGPIYLV
ncbi:MAG: hypothetical protein KIS62_01300 [Ramlibacter sp.]|nr:hypothetical protein [Ramlibacter sp.]